MVTKHKLIIRSVDTETTGLDLHHGAKPYFVTMCDPEGNLLYWEAEVDPLTREPLWSHKDLAEIQQVLDETDVLVLQNTKFDFHALETIGIAVDHLFPKVFDTLIAGHLIRSNQPHDLTTMAMIYMRLNIQKYDDALEVAIKEAKKIVKKKYPNWRLAQKGLPEMPSAKEKTWKYDSWLPAALARAEGYLASHPWWETLIEYANADSGATIGLYVVFKKIIEERGLWKIFESRMALLEPVYAMEVHGMCMDEMRTEHLYKRLVKEAEDCRQQCLELVDNEIEDLPVNGMSNDLRYALFDKLGLKSPKKTKTGRQSADKFVLDHWIATLPQSSRQFKFVNNLRRYRKRKTAIGYIHSYEKFALPYSSSDEWQLQCTSIVYPSYNPTGTDTLRFTSQNPNSQQVSKQEEVNTRYCYGPPPGYEWWAIDFSNLELRIPAYGANEPLMVDLFEHPDRAPYFGSYHLLVFDILHPDKFANHGMACKDVFADTWYQWTKNGNFAVQYGAVITSGTADKAYHVPGAQRQIMGRFKRIKALSDRMIDLANERGYVETLPDLTVDPDRGYPLYCHRTDRGKVLETLPLSYHVQGTAMWITSKAMMRCHKYLTETDCGGTMISQIHDEIIFQFPKGEGVKHIAKLQVLMEMSGDDVGIPLGTTIHYHPITWAITEEFDLCL